MNKLDKDYQNLLKDILENGTKKETRNGGTISVFGRQIRHNMKDGFPLLTTKKMPFKTIVTELLWFLQGDTNIKYLVDNNCHIWDGDAYKNYCKEYWNLSFLQDKIEYGSSFYNHDTEDYTFEELSQEEFINKIKTDDEFAKKWGELGPIYGKQWREWKQFIPYDVTEENCKVAVKVTDQIANLINDLKTNPDSRRLMVNAWNVGELDQMVLPPCHYGFQVYTRELSYSERYKIWFSNNYETGMEYYEGNIPDFDNSYYNPTPTRAISLMWNQRSVDTFLGLPFNIASYGLLLEIIAKEVNMVSDELIGNLGDVHLYSNHIEQAKEQIGREFTEEEIQEHLEHSGMDALRYKPRMEYISKLPKRTREPFPLPTLKMKPCPITGISLEYLSIGQFEIENYQSHPTIKAPLSN